jgi:uncharacterized membrane protein
MTADPSPDRVGATAASALALAMLAWALALPLAPVAREAGTWPAVASSAVYSVGALVCHQRPERSFVAGGRPWPVCARCAGIYLAAGVAVLALSGARGMRTRLASRPGAAWRTLFVAVLTPVVVSWVAERAGLWDSSNAARALSGIPLGLAVAAAVVANIPVGRAAPRT